MRGIIVALALDITGCGIIIPGVRDGSSHILINNNHIYRRYEDYNVL